MKRRPRARVSRQHAPTAAWATAAAPPVAPETAAPPVVLRGAGGGGHDIRRVALSAAGQESAHRTARREAARYRDATVMRDDAGAASAAPIHAPGNVGGGLSGKFTLDKLELGERTLGPLDAKASLQTIVSVEEIAVTGTGTASGGMKVAGMTAAGQAPAANIADTPAPTQARGGAVGNGPNNSVGVSGEIKTDLSEEIKSELGQEVYNSVKEWKPSLKGAGELGPQAAKFGVGMTLEGKHGPVPVTYSPLTFNLLQWKAGSPPEFAVVTSAAEVDLLTIEYQTAGGKLFKIKAKPKLELEVKPSPLRMASWALEASEALFVSELALAGTLIAGGALAIGSSLYQIANSGETTDRTEAAVKQCKNYCLSFANVIKGLAPVGEPGGAEGASAGQQFLQQRFGQIPYALVAQKAQSMDLYGIAWAQGWPQIKAKAISDYWEDHWFEKTLYGEGGAGSGGFATFKRVLDAVGG